MNLLPHNLPGVEVLRVKVGNDELQHDFEIDGRGVEVWQVQNRVHVIFGLADGVSGFFALIAEEVAAGAFVVVGVIVKMNFIFYGVHSLIDFQTQ